MPANTTSSTRVAGGETSHQMSSATAAEAARLPRQCSTAQAVNLIRIAVTIATVMLLDRGLVIGPDQPGQVRQPPGPIPRHRHAPQQLPVRAPPTQADPLRHEI